MRFPFETLPILFRLLCVCQSVFERCCELIGAGRVFETALDALESCDQILGFHAFAEHTDALEIAVAAAGVDDVGNDVVLIHAKTDGTGTGSAAVVGVFHDDFPSFIIYRRVHKKYTCFMLVL